MPELFDAFPHLETHGVIIRKMDEGDLDRLRALSWSDAVYRYCPHFLWHKKDGDLRAAVRNLGARDFDNKRTIIAGVYLPEQPDVLIGLAEIFDYDAALRMVTIGYKLDEAYWGRGIATRVIAALRDYLLGEIRLNRVQAFVMPANIASGKALMKNGFVREGLIRRGYQWNGQGAVDLEIYAMLSSDFGGIA